MIRYLFALTTLYFCTAVHSQEIYRTILGNTYTIEDHQARRTTDTSLSHVILTDPSTITRKEEKKIRKLEAQADQRELTTYLEMKKAQAETSSVDRSAIQLYNQARDIAALVKRLPNTKKAEREQLYIRIDRLIDTKVPAPLPSKSAMHESDRKIKDYPEVKADKRPIWELLENETCTYVFDGFDKSLDTRRKETEAVHLFGHTHPKLRRHFPDNDYITTVASMAKIGRDHYLVLQIDIASKGASKSFGSLKAGEKVRIRFVDGRSIYGLLANNQSGYLQEYTGHTIYNPLIKIHKDDIKALQKKYLDDIGIMWSSGFENYEIYHVGALQNIAKCIRQ